MITKHRTTIKSRCPVSSMIDEYDVTFSVRGRIVPVEQIKDVIDRLTEKALFQEELTKELSKRLQCDVKTIGTHSDFETICKVRFE